MFCIVGVFSLKAAAPNGIKYYIPMEGKGKTNT